MIGETKTVTVNEWSRLNSAVKQLKESNDKLRAENDVLKDVIARAMRNGAPPAAELPPEPRPRAHLTASYSSAVSYPAPDCSFDLGAFLVGETLGLTLGEINNYADQCTNNGT